jgi:hypothetical protein
VHTDAGADKLNKQLSAKAFTTGSDIFFKRGAYEPGSSGGRELIAHELSHVVQQDTGQVSGGGSGMTVRPAGDSFEQVAEGQRQQAGRQRAVVNPILAFADPTMALRRRYGNEPPTRQVARRGPERLAETKVQPAAHQDAVRSGRLKYRFVLRSRNQAVVQRQLATRVGQIPAAPVFCHPAVWIWAGLEAQGGVHPVNHQNTLQSIVLARPSAQERMLDVPRQKDWRFLWLRQKRTDLTQNMPPDGTVLLWDQGATHSAVAVNGRIAGYNNRAIVPTPLPNPAGVDGNLNGFSRITPDNLNPDWHVCRTISEATIVRIARRLIQRGPFVW